MSAARSNREIAGDRQRVFDENDDLTFEIAYHHFF
jgi:hypothetical protein